MKRETFPLHRHVDPRQRAVVHASRKPRSNAYVLELSCGHVVSRKFMCGPPLSVICTQCPAAGGMTNK